MNGSLHSCLTGSGKATIQETERIKILAGIAEGMQYLGTLSFVHRDLACRNVLLDVKKAPRVSDFGMSRKMSSTDVYASVNTKVSAALSAHCPLSSESSSVASVGSRDLTHRISTRQCFGACFSASPSLSPSRPFLLLLPHPTFHSIQAHGNVRAVLWSPDLVPSPDLPDHLGVVPTSVRHGTVGVDFYRHNPEAEDVRRRREHFGLKRFWAGPA